MAVIQTETTYGTIHGKIQDVRCTVTPTMAALPHRTNTSARHPVTAAVLRRAIKEAHCLLYRLSDVTDGQLARKSRLR